VNFNLQITNFGTNTKVVSGKILCMIKENEQNLKKKANVQNLCILRWKYSLSMSINRLVNALGDMELGSI
jgi:hypothetical protein